MLDMMADRRNRSDMLEGTQTRNRKYCKHQNINKNKGLQLKLIKIIARTPKQTHRDQKQKQQSNQDPKYSKQLKVT